MFCRKCGSKNEDDAKFCNSCGEKFMATLAANVENTKKNDNNVNDNALRSGLASYIDDYVKKTTPAQTAQELLAGDPSKNLWLAVIGLFILGFILCFIVIVVGYIAFFVGLLVCWHVWFKAKMLNNSKGTLAKIVDYTALKDFLSTNLTYLELFSNWNISEFSFANFKITSITFTFRNTKMKIDFESDKPRQYNIKLGNSSFLPFIKYQTAYTVNPIITASIKYYTDNVTI